jgi:fructose-1,6-bisphosphatase/inositol monophosphatase family enzyme
MLNHLERAAIESYRESAPAEPPAAIGLEERAVFLGFRLLLEAGRLIRRSRGAISGPEVSVKDDGSPVTEVEHQIEATLREWLSSFDPEAVVVGEETGGTLPAKGVAVAIDPIDGTRAFLAETEAFATTLALIQDRVTRLGMVANPTTGEIAYGVAGGDSRLVRLSVFGEGDEAQSMRKTSGPSKAILVNLHPSRKAGQVVHYLYQGWEKHEISMVRSPGGSPAWALVEAARGHFVYANLWSKQPAEAFDLAAGTLVVRGAGGEVIDLEGQPIDELHHSGPFVAGLDMESRSRVKDLLYGALEEAEKGVSPT